MDDVVIDHEMTRKTKAVAGQEGRLQEAARGADRP